MAKLVSVFISRRYRRLMGFTIWILVFTSVLAALGWYGLQQTREAMLIEMDKTIGHYVKLRQSVLSTFQAMHAELTAEPCSPEFHEQLRRVAYRPDGLNEFLYAPGGQVRCSTDRNFDNPVDLGQPDIPPFTERGATLWIDRDLSFLGLPDLRGTVITSGPYAAVIPSQMVEIAQLDWLHLQIVLTSKSGRWWHRQGDAGVYDRLLDAQADGPPLLASLRYELVCDSGGVHCAAGEADISAVLADASAAVIVSLLLATLVASFATDRANRLITRYWSLEARFRRHLNADSIVCHYQPVMDLTSGEIIGCEVLARWRDVDDRIVFPDQFVWIVENHGLTMRFTEMVARRAYKELSSQIPAGKRLQVNFNVFPRDLDCHKLTRIFSDFTSQPDRFDVVLEIIECNEFPATAQQEIELLRLAGIKTYIDDFGTGYSNMKNLATLAVDGVKLDRSFAMAADDSLMARMLSHAVDMIQATGRVMVVEGIETAERLRMLRAMAARIDHVQGYFISRPLDIAKFVQFLRDHPLQDEAQQRKAA